MLTGGLLNHWENIPFILVVLLIAFACHEFAHAYAADKFGDPTPRSMGRVTLNPMVHLDLFGTILILLVGFGWAKPVLVNPNYFKKPRLMGIVVSVVGPLANLILAFIGVMLFFGFGALGLYDGLPAWGADAISVFYQALIHFNLLLFLFNLLPLPPLDGYRILNYFLPMRARLALQGVEQWFIFIFMILVFFPVLNNNTLGRVFSLIDPIWDGMASFARTVYGL
ncbi:site-2 protease family protein [Gorillibacterium massiliense]|uniref:site-2 protease family protein n=1 Tax=Gorillibacterium massiliense TaxID=1280390 RepID=UPI0004B6C5DF|nr:site-2 protease family protein [Gorillibacterium massiliense]